MSPRAVRALVLGAGAFGVAGMILFSILSRTGGALAAGMVAGLAGLSLLLITSVSAPEVFAKRSLDDETAIDLERRIRALVAAGADELAVRELVGEALRANRSSRD